MNATSLGIVNSSLIAMADPAGTVRAAAPGDEPAFLEMWRDFVQVGPEPCPPEAPALAFRRALDAASPMRCLIAESAEARPVGFALYVVHPYSWSTRDVCYLLDLYVRPEARGRRHGSALIEEMARIGRAAGWLRINWMAQPDNPLAHALYGKVAKRSPLVRYDLYLSPH